MKCLSNLETTLFDHSTAESQQSLQRRSENVDISSCLSIHTMKYSGKGTGKNGFASKR
jgi:hypothetical protein